MSAEEEEQAENVGNIGVEDLISDDDLEDWLACFLGSDSEDEIEELRDLDHDGVCFIFISMSLCLSSNFRTLLGNSMRVICTMSLLLRQSIHLLLKINRNSIKHLWIIWDCLDKQGIYPQDMASILKNGMRMVTHL